MNDDKCGSCGSLIDLRVTGWAKCACGTTTYRTASPHVLKVCAGQRWEDPTTMRWFEVRSTDREQAHGTSNTAGYDTIPLEYLDGKVWKLVRDAAALDPANWTHSVDGEPTLYKCLHCEMITTSVEAARAHEPCFCKGMGKKLKASGDLSGSYPTPTVFRDTREEDVKRAERQAEWRAQQGRWYQAYSKTAQSAELAKVREMDVKSAYPAEFFGAGSIADAVLKRKGLEQRVLEGPAPPRTVAYDQKLDYPAELSKARLTDSDLQRDIATEDGPVCPRLGQRWRRESDKLEGVVIGIFPEEIVFRMSDGTRATCDAVDPYLDEDSPSWTLLSTNPTTEPTDQERDEEDRQTARNCLRPAGVSERQWDVVLASVFERVGVEERGNLLFEAQTAALGIDQYLRSLKERS